MLFVDAAASPQEAQIEGPSDRTAMENESLTLTCSATCYPPCKMKWVKGNEVIAEGEVLVISSMKREDQGEYKCIADNGIPPASSSIVNISVQCKCF